VWSTPGGVLEPDERPADAVARETWEETGLLVEPLHVCAVFGGPEFVVRYPNGDETQYVIIAFACVARGGSLRLDTDETIAAKYWSEREALSLALAPWLRSALADVYASCREPISYPVRWTPSL
jgi:ADP-ribose pyrophosphatase YjhB (NUDIX family)